MRAEIVSIGTELLLGQIVDTNAAYIAEKLAELGIDLYHKVTVGDNEERIVKILKTSLQRADVIITTGGLGPTEDDLTRRVIAKAMGVELVKDEDLAKRIKDFFEKLSRPMTKNNITQAYVPVGAEPIVNEQGTAPGIILEKDGKTIISMPGVPSEMKRMMQEKVIPYLEGQLDRGHLIKSKVLKVCGYGESSLETEIKDILDQQTNPTLALLSGKAEVNLRITAKTEAEEEADRLIREVETELRKRLGNNVFGVNDETMEEVVGFRLKEKELTLAVAESCTGGLIGHRITSVPGSSNYFERGIISYSNRAKRELLKVREKTLKENGAVSRQTAEEMAQGVKRLAETDVGIAVSGIAGPTGGTEEKPVGLIYMGIAHKQLVKSFKFKFHGTRQEIKYLTSQYTLDKLRRYLEGSLEL